VLDAQLAPARVRPARDVAGGDDARRGAAARVAHDAVALFGRAGRLTGAAAIGPARRFLPWRRALAEDLGFDEAIARAGS